MHHALYRILNRHRASAAIPHILTGKIKNILPAITGTDGGRVSCGLEGAIPQGRLLLRKYFSINGLPSVPISAVPVPPS